MTALLVRNVGTRVWIWPWGEDGPTRVAPDEEIWIEFSPPLKRQPGESGVDYLDRVNAACEAGDPRVALFVSLRDAGMLGPPLGADAPQTMH
jgi:hypothetical protein